MVFDDKEYQRKYYLEHKEVCKARSKENYLKNKEAVQARHKVWVEKNRGKLREYQRTRGMIKRALARGDRPKKSWNRHDLKETRKQYASRIKLEILTHYSNGVPQCACCGEKTLVFLTIDHINGAGSQHKREVLGSDKGGINFYFWLRKNHYPSGFQVLCWNCNAAKGILGTCPHQKIGGLPRN